MYLNRIRYCTATLRLGHLLVKPTQSVRLLASFVKQQSDERPTAAVTKEEKKRRVLQHSFEWVGTLLNDLSEASAQNDTKKFLFTLQRFHNSYSKGLPILPKVQAFLTNDFIAAQTNNSVGELLVCLGALKLNWAVDERHRRIVTLLFKKATTLNNMSVNAMLTCVSGLASCGVKWSELAEVKIDQELPPDSPFLIPIEQCKQRFLDQLCIASLEISHFRAANQVLIGLSKMGFKYFELPVTLQTELISSATKQLFSYELLCKETLRALFQMEFSPHLLDQAKKNFVMEMIRVAFKAEWKTSPVNVYSLFKFILSTLRMEVPFSECPDDLIRYVEEGLLLVELQPVGITAVLKGLSQTQWPWLRFPTSFRTKFEALLVHNLPSLSDEEFVEVLRQWTTMSVPMEDLSEPLQDALLEGVASRHPSGRELVSVLSSLGKLSTSVELLPSHLLEQLVNFLTVEVQSYDDSDVVRTIEALASLNLDFNALPSSVQEAVENAVVYHAHRFQPEQIDAMLQAFTVMNAPFNELPASLQKVLMTCSVLFDQSVPLLDQLTKMKASWLQLDYHAKKSLLAYLEPYFKKLKIFPRKTIDSVAILANCGLKWGYLTEKTHHCILNSLINRGCMTAEQFHQLISLMIQFEMPWKVFPVRLQRNLLLNISQPGLFTRDNAGEFVDLLSLLQKCGAAGSSFLLRRIRSVLPNCAAGIDSVAKVSSLLRTLTEWEMSLRMFEQQDGDLLLKIVNAQIQECGDFETLTDLMMNVALLSFDLPPGWDRTQLQEFHARAAPEAGRLRRPDVSQESLNKFAIYREVYGMQCEPLIVVKRSVEVPAPSGGLRPAPYVMPNQERSRDRLLEHIIQKLGEASNEYEIRKGGYLLNSSGFAVDGIIYAKEKLLGFLDVDMDQYHNLYVDTTDGRVTDASSDGTSAEVAKNVIVVFDSHGSRNRHALAAECKQDNLLRILKLKDKIHGRYFKDQTAPIFRTMPLLMNKTLSQWEAEKLGARIAEKIIIQNGGVVPKFTMTARKSEENEPGNVSPEQRIKFEDEKVKE